MLTFAAFLPHPPIIIPQIGDKNCKKCQKTIKAFEEIARVSEKSEIETLIVVSPHTALHPGMMTISFNDYAIGNFSAFDNPEVKSCKEIDTELAEEAYKTAEKSNIPTRLLEQEGSYNIDHASLVPLIMLENSMPSSVKIIIIGISLLDRQMHLNFGKAIYKAVSKIGYNVGVVFSGDMSHKIFEEGAEFVGQKFDKEICLAIDNNQMADILKIDEYLQDEAGECGYNSLLVSLGMLQEHGLDKVTSKVLSYEAPFGVGYMVANFQLRQPNNQ